MVPKTALAVNYKDLLLLLHNLQVNDRSRAAAVGASGNKVAEQLVGDLVL